MKRYKHCNHKYDKFTMYHYVVTYYYYYYPLPPHTQRKCMDKGNTILVRMVVKAKVGELEDGCREVFYRHVNKELTGVVQGVYVKRMLLVNFQYGC